MNLIITKTFFLLSVSFVFSFYTWADKTIDVGANGSSFSTSTTPVSITLGEKIIFNFIGGFHNAESVSIPAGAASFRSGNAPSSGKFDYIPSIVGVYTFKCEIHGASGTSGMVGSFTVTGTASTSSIITGQLSSLTICGGNAIQFPFTTTGIFNSDGIFVAQLSDMTGSFNNATVIASNLANPNIMNATIPSAIASGNQYRMRVIYTSLIENINGSDNGADIVASSNPSLLISSNFIGSICPGTLVSFSATGFNTLGSKTYDWFVNGSVTGVKDEIYNTSIIGNGDMVFAKLYSSASCSSNLVTVVSNSIVYEVSANIVPTISISGTSNYLNNCPERVITITSFVNGGGINPIVNWSVTGISVSTLIGNNFIVKISKGNISATLISSLSCANNKTVTSNILMPIPFISEEPLANVLITTSGSGLEVIRILEGTKNNAFGGPFLWYLNNNPLPNSNSASFTPTVSGVYKASFIQTCPSTSDGYNFTLPTTSVNNPDFINDITIYPNPATDKIFISVKSGTAKAELVSFIYNLDGKKLIEKPFESGTCKGGKGKQCLCPGVDEVDVSDLNAGTYIVFVTDGLKTLTKKKIIKQ